MLFLATVLGLSACITEPRTPVGLVGRPLDVALTRYGRPETDRVLDVRKGERLMELRSGLYRTVLDTLAEGSTARVREVHWGQVVRRAAWAVERDGRWMTVDALRWPGWIQF